MSAALLQAARGRTTDNPYLGAIFTAQAVNHALGTNSIMPWEVWELPQEWLDACLAVSSELPEIKKKTKEMDDFITAWKAKAMKRSH